MPMSTSSLELALALLATLLAVAAAHFAARLWTALRLPAQLSHLPRLPLLDQIRIVCTVPTISQTSAAVEAAVRNPDLHVMYGLGEYMVVVKHPLLVKETYDRPLVFDKYDPSADSPDTVLGRFFGNNVGFVPTAGAWRFHRRLLNPAFSRGFDPAIFGDSALIAIRRILSASEPDRTFEAWPLMSEAMLVALGRFAFGDMPSGFGAVVQSIYDPLTIMLPAIDTPWNPLRRRAFANLDEMEEIFFRMVEQKRSEARALGGYSNIATRDVLTCLVEAFDRGGGDLELTPLMLRGDIASILTAGSDTSSSALNSAMFLLAKHRDIQDRARRHVLDVLGDAREDITPSAEEQRQLTYLTQILKEAMHHYTPGLQGAFRRATEDCWLGSYFIPKGTLMIQDYWMAHRHPAFWSDDDASRFNPDRFANDAKDTYWSPQNPGWMPFGLGTRGCLGMPFAFMEMRIVLAMLLRRFEWRLADDHSGTLELTASILPRVVSNRLTFTARY
ncbi:cytochrome P450 [Ramicandelaber brevisporus]|nr:cytochrome P450 [Ramicandelaber brevisporus]